MSDNNTGGSSCRGRNHYRDRWAIYESLPPEVRDKIKIAKSNVCAGCIRNSIRRNGLEWVLDDLDFKRRLLREKRGKEVWYLKGEDLRP